MAPLKKSAWRGPALLNALCPGILPALTPGRAGYEQFVGLWLNRGELLNQAAAVVYTGGSYVHSTDDIPGEIFLAICEDEAQAFERMCTTNNAREMARLRGQPHTRTQSILR